MDAGIWQGDVGDDPGHSLMCSSACDSGPVAGACAGLPRAPHLRPCALESRFPVEEGHLLRPQ